MLNHLFKNAKTILSLLIIVIFASIYATIQIPKEQEPNVQIPIFYATTGLKVSAIDGVDLLYKPMENAVKNLDSITKTYGGTHSDGAFLVMELSIKADIDEAYNDISRALDNVELPEDARDIRLYEIMANDQPILTIDLESSESEEKLYEWADELQETIEGVPGVLEVDISGKRTKYVELVVKPEILSTYNISPKDISALFSGLNNIVTIGQQSERTHGKFTLKIPFQLRDINQILDITILSNQGQELRLRDIVSYKTEWRAATNLSRLNMQKTVSIRVKKGPEANLKETTDLVKQQLEVKQQEMPENIKLHMGVDQTEAVDSMLSYMSNSVFLTVICIMLVVIALLGFRDGILVGLSIPMSFLMGIALLYLFDFTLNSVVIFGLTLSLGILIDNAIIIVEYARIKLRQGHSLTESFKFSVRTMALPLMTSTLTTLVVFLPLIFWPGIMGAFMKNIPIAMILVLASSLLIALVFTPLLAVYFSGVLKVFVAIAIGAIAFIWGKGQQVQFGPMEIDLGSVLPILAFLVILVLLQFIKFKPKQLAKSDYEVAIEDVPIDTFCKQANFIVKIYYVILKIILRVPRLVILAIVGLMFGIWFTVATNNKGTSFFPENSIYSYSITIDVPGNLSLIEKNKFVHVVEQKVMDYADTNDNVEKVITYVGSAGRLSSTKQIGNVTVMLVDWKKRTQTAESIKAELNKILATITGIDAYIGIRSRGPTLDQDLLVDLEGTDLASIQQSAVNVREWLQQNPKFREVEDSIKRSGIEFLYTPNRTQAYKYGVSVNNIADTINMLTSGVDLGSFKPVGESEEVDIYLIYPKKYRTITAIDDLWIEGRSGMVPLSYVVDKTTSYPTKEVQLENGKMGAKVEGYFKDKRDNVNKVKKQFIDDIKNHPTLLVGDTKVKLAGNAVEEQQTQQFLMVSFALAIGAMVIILLLQFNSFYLMGVIMFAIVFSTAGVFLGVIIADKPFSIVMSGLAIITLAGIVVNDNIVLIDTFQNLCRTEKDMKVAVLKTAVLRMGPVILTSVTTALGMLPATLSISMDIFNRQIEFNSPNAMFWQQIAQNIFVGVLFALVLTLVFTPCALYAKYRKTPYVSR